MTRTSRRIIFFSLVLIFLAVTPGVILFASGYTFDWQKWQLVKTGAFYFKSAPNDAKIVINGESKDTTPGFIDHLLPDRYIVEISKNGYLAWKKNLSVRPQETTEARNIVLVPEKPETLWIADNVTSTAQYFLSAEEKSAKERAAIVASSSLKDTAGFAFFENEIYYLQKPNLLLFKTDLNTSSKQQLSFEPLKEPQTPYQIIASPQRIAVFEKNGNAYLLNQGMKTFEFLSDGVLGIEFSSDNQKLLFWTDHEIWVMWLKEILGQPQKKPGDKELIARYGDKISQAIWFLSTNEHIIYAVVSSDGAKIKFTELDGRDSRNTYDIFSASDAQIYFNNDNELLYILTSGRLFSVNLLAP